MRHYVGGGVDDPFRDGKVRFDVFRVYGAFGGLVVTTTADATEAPVGTQNRSGGWHELGLRRSDDHLVTAFAGRPEALLPENGRQCLSRGGV